MEDQAIPLDVSAALTDTDGSETLSVTIGGVPAGAILSAGTDNGGGGWTLAPADLAGLELTPAADFNGAFDLTVTATAREADGGTAASTATLRVTVAAVNDAPVAADGGFVADPGLTYQGVLSASDVDGDDLTYGVTQAPSHGTLALAADGSFTYLPADQYFGADSFTYTVADPSGASASGVVAVTVARPGNLVIGDAADNTLTGTEAVDTLYGLGGDDTLWGGGGDDRLIGGTGNDALNGGMGDDQYGFARGDGADTVRDRHYQEQSYSYQETYTYYDTVSYTYETWEFMPSGQDGYYQWVTHTGTRQEERTGTRLVEGTEIVHEDAGADLIAFGSGIAAGDVVLRLSGDDLIVAIKGPDDADAPFDALTDKITIVGWADPKDRIERFRFADGSEVDISRLASTLEALGDTAGVTLAGGGGQDWIVGGSGDDALTGGGGDDHLDGGPGVDTAHYAGRYADYAVSLVGSGATVTGPEGTDSLSNVERLVFADFSVFTDGTNNAPTAAPDAATTAEDQAVTIAAADLMANDTDVDGDALTLTAVGNPVGGTVALDSNGDVVFTPAADFTGPARFDYTLSDGTKTSTATVSVEITPVNDAPVAADDAVVGSEGTTLTIAAADLLANDTDVDGDALSLVSVGNAANGMVALNAAGDVVFTPAADFNGEARFDYTVFDGAATSSATVTVLVAPVNDPPVAAPDTAATAEDTAVLIAAADLLANDSDVDGGPLRLTAVGNAVGGAVALDVNGDVVFTPAPDFNGPAGFDYTLTDEWGATATGRVAVDVSAVADAPAVSGPVTLTVAEDTPLTITAAELLANASDADGDPLLVANLAADKGILTNNGDGTWTLQPDANFAGTVTLSYQVSDGTASTAAVATVEVTAVNDAPVAAPDTAATTEDTGLTIAAADLLANDSDADGDGLALIAVGNASGGSVGLDGNGDVVFTPAANFNGQASFDYTVADGRGGTGTATVLVAVAAVNDAPTAADASLVAPPGVPYEGVLPAADVDGDVLGYAITSAPAHGTVTLAADGGFTYVAADGYFGSDGFTYTATDPSGASATGQVSLTVAAPGNLVIGDASANILEGTDGADTLIGLGGDDTLAGGAGDDWLMGGTGDDAIDGGPGDDRYRFQRGDGADNLRDRYYEERAFSYEETYTYYDTVSYTYETWEYVPSGQDGYYDWVTHTGTRQEQFTGTRLVEGTEIVHEDGGADVIVFGAGIAADHLELRLSGDDLIVGVRDPGDPDAAFETLTDKLTLAGWAEPKDRIERFRFADGSEVEIASLSPAPAGLGGVGGAEAADAAAGGQATVASNLEAARTWFAREGDNPALSQAQGDAPPAGSNVESLVTAMAGFDPPDAGEAGLAPDPQDHLAPTIAVDAYAGA